MSDATVTKKTQRVYQVLDLKEIFGVSFTKAGGLKEKISQALIDKMKDRVAKGVDVDGDKMKPYSKEYKDSDEYKAARKTGVVNMSLSGDMIGSIDVLKDSGNKVTIGFTDRTQELKAHRHMVGDNVPVREFFGITDKEINAVKREFREDIRYIKESVNSPKDAGKAITLKELRDQILNFPNRDLPLRVEEE